MQKENTSRFRVLDLEGDGSLLLSPVAEVNLKEKNRASSLKPLMVSFSEKKDLGELSPLWKEEMEQAPIQDGGK